MKLEKPVNIQTLCNILNLTHDKFEGSIDFEFNGINDVYNCIPLDMIFIENEKVVQYIKSPSQLFVITTDQIYSSVFKRFKNCVFYKTDTPFDVFINVINHTVKKVRYDFNECDRSTIPNTCKVASNTYIGENCLFGNNTIVYPNVTVGSNVTIGNNSILHPNVTVYDNVNIGNNVIIHSGAVIGSDGCYYSAKRVKFPMIGTVIIEDNVEIGANSTIDRASTHITSIGKGTKIDNHVHIAHDVKIGSNCLILAHAAISGQATIGDEVVIRGMSGVLDMLSVADKSEIYPLSGVTKSTKPAMGYIGMPAEEYYIFAKRKAEERLATYYKKIIDKMLNLHDASATQNMKTIFELIKSISGVTEISQKDKLLGVILDSLEVLELIMALQDHFGIELDESKLNQYTTVKDIVTIVNDRLLNKSKLNK
jgi:UDP-3-O-[3-hydroxymyristoyl] glucosamine N-acyltransferase